MSGYKVTDTIRLAHTARCKLQLAADRPDRNLRFILGHAFTLDKIRLRIAEIEIESSDDDEDDLEDEDTAPQERRVSFHHRNSPRPATADRKRSPPPDQFAHLQDTDSDSSDDNEEEDGIEGEEVEDLSLQRFESGSARPPQMVDDDSSSSDEDEPQSPPFLTEEELKSVTKGDDDTDMVDAYNHVARCPCHGHDVPKAEKAWDIPQKPGFQGGRLAVVQVTA